MVKDKSSVFVSFHFYSSYYFRWFFMEPFNDDLWGIWGRNFSEKWMALREIKFFQPQNEFGIHKRPIEVYKWIKMKKNLKLSTTTSQKHKKERKDNNFNEYKIDSQSQLAQSISCKKRPSLIIIYETFRWKRNKIE